jgi:outer membrane protein assembly factor BamB
MTLLSVVLISGLGVAANAVSAGDWARFRGAGGAGVAADTDIPLEWTAADGLIWKTPIPGSGNSSPIVCRNRVFVQSASADGTDRSLFCLDARDGKILWSQATPGARGRIHRLNSPASATPTTDGQRVYAAFWNGRDMALHAFSFDGKRLWQRELGPFVSQHGPGTSPIVYAGKVFFANDQDGSSVVYALDGETGRVMWEARRRAFRASYATPVVLEGNGVSPELIVASSAGVTSYKPETGEENWHWTWQFDGEPLRCVAAPQVCGDLIVVTAGDGDGRRSAAALRLGGKTAWQSDKRIFPYVPSPVVSDGRLYYVNDKGFACSISTSTGETVWAERVGGEYYASPILIKDKVYAISHDGVCNVFAAASPFRLLARSEIGERVTATPAVADHKLFIRGESHLFCIGKSAQHPPR